MVRAAALIRATIPKQPTGTLMTFTDQILSIADNNGQIPYGTALQAADWHGAAECFLLEYGSALQWIASGVDAGEFLVWLGY